MIDTVVDKREGESGEAESASFLSVAYGVALKTALFFLAFVILFTAVLSFGVPGTEKVYFALELYGKAVSQSERVLKRKATRLDRFYEGSQEYQSYALDEYLPALARTVDYSIAHSMAKPSRKTAKKALERITQFFEEQGIAGSGSYSDIISAAQMNAVNSRSKVLLFDYNAYLQYNLIRCAMLAAPSDVMHYTASTTEELVRQRISYHSGILDNENYRQMFDSYKPDSAITAYFEQKLQSIDFIFPSNLNYFGMMGAIELIEKSFNFDKYNNDLFDIVLSVDDSGSALTSLYTDIKSVYNKNKDIIIYNGYTDDIPFPEDAELMHKVRYLWYERVRFKTAYSMASVFAVIRAYNNNSTNPNNDNIDVGRLAEEFVFWNGEYVDAISKYNSHLELI